MVKKLSKIVEKEMPYDCSIVAVTLKQWQHSNLAEVPTSPNFISMGVRGPLILYMSPFDVA